MKNWSSLEGKTIWVSGGAGHLGGPITAELDRCCAKVVCLDQPGRAEAFIAEQKLQRTVPATLDLCDAAAIRAGVEPLFQQHGVPDGVVHLVFASSGGIKMEDLPAETFAATITKAIPPTFEFCRALGERMKQRGGGSVVMFSSMYGVVAPDPRMYHPPMAPNPIDYGANKAAILQMTRYLAVHYGPAKVRFNAITPGPFPNPRVQASDPTFLDRLGAKTALQRIGQREEIVGPALFLLTDSASYVTGQSLAVDGGWTVM
jgi:NAD(P)-dependent dehydrogenase (short-subunit alcohol dehydrogenase family)